MSDLISNWRCSACGVTGSLRFTMPVDASRLWFDAWNAHAAKSAECARTHDGESVEATVTLALTALTATPLTRRQAALYDFVLDEIATRRAAPSFAEIAENFGYRSLATVHEHLQALERKGWIRRRYNESRAIECLVLDASEARGAA